MSLKKALHKLILLSSCKIDVHVMFVKYIDCILRRFNTLKPEPDGPHFSDDFFAN